jgi:hypothetical protein
MYGEAISAYRSFLELNAGPFAKSLLALALAKQVIGSNQSDPRFPASVRKVEASKLD